ncbi:PREDICTED: synapse-associated protein of 47 kDa-like isoform X2 [Bactrocera latifrons]|nr:PREDICTED: synapse-associated protein of 47 kDa-like isoform X2 [Bactrocera latifrons]
MFSGLTNQFTSLVGAVKGGQADEDVPAPTQDAVAAPEVSAATAAPTPAAGAEQAANAAGVSGEQPVEGEEGAKSGETIVDHFLTEATGWLGSAKGWLGSASASIPSMPAMPTMSMPSMPAMPAMPSMPSIPGLRKGGAEAGEGVAADGAVAESGDPTGAVSGEDDDKSRYISATEGADSHPASGGGTPTGDEGQIGQVTTKVTQQAKHFGSFLSSAINKAGAKIKETVKENPILESFNKEQEAFIKSQGGADSGVAPWIGHSNEAKIKEEILGLSQDRRNFVRAPPAGVDFDFNYDTAYPTAIAIMAEDKALETMRFELVPKIITEENFWRNYFYRVSLIIQAAELGTLGADGVGQASSGEDVKKTQTDKSPAKAAALAVGAEQTSANDKDAKTSTPISPIFQQPIGVGLDKPVSQKSRHSESEFVSDSFHTNTETDLEEIKDGMRKLGIDSMTEQALGSDEEQWEKDLEAELKDYEVVSDTTGGTTTAHSRDRGGGSTHAGNTVDRNGDDDEIPTISNLRTRSTNNDWEEYADLIEDTDDLKTLKSLKRVMLGYQ